MEQYAIHIAPRGGKVDLIIDEINAARQAALEKRREYSRSKGAIGLWQNESTVSGLIFDAEAKIPDGWALKLENDGKFVAVPKAKGRTRVAREAYSALMAELASLPSLNGAAAFTKLIGSSEVITANGSGRFCLRSCYYERIGKQTFVMTPWTTKADEVGENVNAEAPTEKTRIAFLPEGCERVGLSAYYAAKERAGVPAVEI